LLNHTKNLPRFRGGCPNPPCIYRTKYNPSSDSQVSDYFDDPVVPLNEKSNPEIWKYGYVRQTSPGRRLEDFINAYNLSACNKKTGVPFEGKTLTKYIKVIAATEREVWETKEFLRDRETVRDSTA